jgi:collagenase-like PrtC family protease
VHLTVPFNWQDDLLSALPLSSVGEFYGQLDRDTVGGGRASCTVPAVRKDKARSLIRDIRDRGISFNYLLNATCMGGRELSVSGQRNLRLLLNWLSSCGVDRVTVAIPYLLDFIKFNYPEFKVYVSTQAGVKDAAEAARWVELGADGITLSVTDINRDFRKLAGIRERVKCELRLIANLDCLYGCPFFRYHSVLNSHASQQWHKSRGFLIDYCFLRCSLKRFRSPEEFIRSGWIRPEDTGVYEDIGINSLKLVNRTMPTRRIQRIVKAYASRSYDGNLLDLFSDPSDTLTTGDRNFIRDASFFLRPASVNVLKLCKFRDIISRRGVFIENRSLDGFIDHFLKSDCGATDCSACGYCRDTAARVVVMDDVLSEQTVKRYETLLDLLLDGAIF